MNNAIPVQAPDELKHKLAAVFDYFNAPRNGGQHQQERDWFVFHMTDWLGDFKNLERLYACPDKLSDAEAGEIVAGVLYHAVNHLTAAARLLLDYAPGDIFKELEMKRA